MTLWFWMDWIGLDRIVTFLLAGQMCVSMGTKDEAMLDLMNDMTCIINFEERVTSLPHVQSFMLRTFLYQLRPLFPQR
jgi:hypothetical protein